MTIIFNLVLFLLIISILLVICNNLSKDENKIKITNKKKNYDMGIQSTKVKSINIPIFNYEVINYETVPENTKIFNLEEKYNKDQEFGAQIVPKYEPPKGEENKEFYKKKHSDQPIIYDNRMYENEISKERIVKQDIDNNLPSKISDIFDASIIDFKNLIKPMNGEMSTLVSDGGFNASAYNPDFMNYENEKPENGGIIPKLYNTVYGNDPLLETNCAQF